MYSNVVGIVRGEGGTLDQQTPTGDIANFVELASAPRDALGSIDFDARDQQQYGHQDKHDHEDGLVYRLIFE